MMWFRPTVHPHVRGDNLEEPFIRAEDAGSPPRAWGLTCFRFFGQVILLFWTARKELSDVESQIAEAW